MVGQKGSQEPVCVLVIEDDPAARRLLAEALSASEGRDIVVHQAADAAQAMDFSGETIAAAAVSVDGGNAPELIALLRQIGILGPILALSRNGSVKNAVEAIRAGADDFVVKPCQPVEIARRLIAKIDERSTSVPLVPAKAGTQRWIPAYAGMRGGVAFAPAETISRLIRCA